MTFVASLTPSKVAALVAVGVLVLFIAIITNSFIRTRRGIAAQAMAETGQVPPTEPKPEKPKKPAPAVTRREFFRRSLAGS